METTPTQKSQDSADLAQDLQPPGAEASTPTRKKFGTFGGVFTPTVLTILGVIMYLREGWVLGNAGLLGGLLIIALAFGITAATGLSMSSIVTNIRIGAGGAYSIISQSLGLEVGGSVGIPLYLSQALAVAMYIFGFREGWLWVFPEHPALLVDLIVFSLIFGIAYISAGLAFRVQYFIMAIIAASLVSIGLAAYTGSMQYSLEDVQLWGTFPGAPEEGFPGTSFWMVFAVFFPAATGIMAGANMSGDLENPRRAIPLGTLSAIGVSFLIYVALAIWLVRSATPEELVSNYTIMIDRAFWGPAVVAGLLGATFSSALASAVGAPRILQALGSHDILLGSRWLARLTQKGEPRNAMLVTASIVFAGLLLRDLNAIAPLITMFFLITYLMINVVLLIEQQLELVSFRPLFRVPISVPLIGTLGCLFAMFIINPTVSLLSIAVVLVFYALLTRRKLDAPFEDVRSGLFVTVAEWAAKQVNAMPAMQERAWRPNLIIPVADTRELRGQFLTILDITYPQGSVKVVGLGSGGMSEEDTNRLLTLTSSFQGKGVFASWALVDTEDPIEGLIGGMQVLRGAFFRPNTLFLTLPTTAQEEEEQRRLIREANQQRLGTLLHAPHPQAGLGQRQTINVWIRDRSPDWQISMDIGNLDLSLLTAYQIKRNWDAKLRLITVVKDLDDKEGARTFLEQIASLGRYQDADVVVGTGDFNRFLTKAPQADLNFFGLLPEPDFDFVRRMVRETGTTCLFVRDSGQESALA